MSHNVPWVYRDGGWGWLGADKNSGLKILWMSLRAACIGKCY